MYLAAGLWANMPDLEATLSAKMKNGIWFSLNLTPVIYERRFKLFAKTIPLILLMEEILHHLGCIKPCKVNNRIFTISTGAGFFLSTVVFVQSIASWGFVNGHLISLIDSLPTGGVLTAFFSTRIGREAFKPTNESCHYSAITPIAGSKDLNKRSTMVKVKLFPAIS